MEATITEIFENGEGVGAHNIFYFSKNTTNNKYTTDRPSIRNINTNDNNLSVILTKNFIDENNNLGDAKIKLKYTGNQKTFTSTINLTIDGITDYEDGLTVPIICNGTLELKPLRFHNISEETKTINLSASATGNFIKKLNIDYQISSDEPNSWENLSNVTIEPINRIIKSFEIPPGESLWVRSNKMLSWYNENNYFYFNSDNNNIGGIELGGDIMSIINDSTMPNNCFYRLFSSLKALSAIESDFTLPANLSSNCYQEMFKECTSLTTVPTGLLPATTLTNVCYTGMFSNCTSLTSAPSLPAKTLANYCYQDMFNGCTSLTSAPSLPATTLASSCYIQMFRGCTSLTSAPSLPATTLANSCYQGMFYGCTSLTTAPALPATSLTDNCYQEMFRGCTSLVNTPSTLPATTLARYCYRGMFFNCTSLTTAPILPAPTLVNYCYVEMLRDCSNLNNITMLATDITTNCFDDWVSGVSSSGTFIKDANTTIPSGPNGIPSNWNVQNK